MTSHALRCDRNRSVASAMVAWNHVKLPWPYRAGVDGGDSVTRSAAEIVSIPLNRRDGRTTRPHGQG